MFCRLSGTGCPSAHKCCFRPLAHAGARTLRTKLFPTQRSAQCAHHHIRCGKCNRGRGLRVIKCYPSAVRSMGTLGFWLVFPVVRCANSDGVQTGARPCNSRRGRTESTVAGGPGRSSFPGQAGHAAHWTFRGLGTATSESRCGQPPPTPPVSAPPCGGPLGHPRWPRAYAPGRWHPAQCFVIG